MFGRKDFTEAMQLECKVAQHLFTKLPRGDWASTLAFRPTKGQRTTLELLRYLSFCGVGATLTCVEGTWDGYARVAQRGASMEADEFPDAMDRQAREIGELLATLTDEDLAARTVRNPPGQELTLARALWDMPLRWLTGYRMQLFLYARQLGAEVWTPDCWYGMSMEKPATE